MTMDEHGWCAAPIIPGDWSELHGADALTMTFEIGAGFDRLDASPDIAGAQPFDDLRIERLRARPLACYPGGLLIEVQARIGEQLGLSNHLYGPWGMHLLDGGSAVLHDLNDVDGALSLETLPQALDYHRLFCNVVRGDEGRFRVIAAPEQVAWHAGADPGAETLALLDRPVQARGVPGFWSIASPVFYGGALFRARFELQRNGMIEMVDDEPLETPFPAEAESWIGPFRIPHWGVPA
ncbi:hypothetical protein [Sphingomonas sp.]|uniref:hypothetical protein n=1 Tax=Sphingomonas sp. TaxID=28214 RepID=UPI001EB53BF0|nr:hypothetical protein [Sphingomonas sp.]MBX3593586.1 hypothetical protein [Sphingomonas sp.]